MIQVKIKNIASQQYTHEAEFPTMEEAQAWASHHSDMGSFGKPTHEVELLDSESLPFDPPQFETIESEFTVEMIDISVKFQQEQTNAASLKYLADTDWMIIREVEGGQACSAEIKQLRAAARSAVVRV